MMSRIIHGVPPLCCFVICVSSALAQSKKNVASLYLKDSASWQTWTLAPHLTPSASHHLTAATIWTLNRICSIRHHQSCWKQKRQHFSLLLCAWFQSQIQAITGNTPSSTCQNVPSWDWVWAGFIYGEKPQGSNQTVIAQGSTACGDSSSSVVTMRNRNQIWKK